MGSLAIGDVPGGAGVLTEGDFEALCRMEVSFKRKKGEYFACFNKVAPHGSWRAYR